MVRARQMDPFKNCLDKNHRILHVQLNKQGKVFRQPKETSRSVCILLDGQVTDRYVDITALQICINGKPDSEIPCYEGELPEKPTSRPASLAPMLPADSGDPLQMLRDRLAGNEREIEGMTNRARLLRVENEKLYRAIAALAE